VDLHFGREGQALRRFFVERIDPENGIIQVTGPEARHMAAVLRMGPGDRLVLMDNTGARCQAVISSVSKGRVSLIPERRLPAPEASPLEITLCPALLKSRSMDLVIQKASELGVTGIQPFFSNRSVVRLQGGRVESRVRHWREIAVNAAKQADRSVPAGIGSPVTFGQLTSAWRDRATPKILLWEAEDSTDLKMFLRQGPPSRAVAITVGPEGGFDAGEIGTAREAGFVTVSLGKRVLRAETAAIAVAAVVQYEWGDLSLRNGPR
jgi:16S rRNA (uracil1498-N3)-methyltransferase